MNEKNKNTAAVDCREKITDEKIIDDAAKEIMKKYKKAFEELAK